MDREARGRRRVRHRHGEDHPAAKLTWEVVKEIREEYAAGGITQAALAARYGVSAGTVWNVLSGRAWRESEEAA
jgi:DNA-binding transcriptional regulator YiaG